MPTWSRRLLTNSPWQEYFTKASIDCQRDPSQMDYRRSVTRTIIYSAMCFWWYSQHTVAVHPCCWVKAIGASVLSPRKHLMRTRPFSSLRAGSGNDCSHRDTHQCRNLLTQPIAFSDMGTRLASLIFSCFPFQGYCILQFGSHVRSVWNACKPYLITIQVGA